MIPDHELVLHPSDKLRTNCSLYEEFGQPAKDFAFVLAERLERYRGIGLAAPQIGVTKRVIAILAGNTTEKEPYPLVLFNPVLISLSENQTSMSEGCLSIPGKRFSVKRPDAVVVRFQNEDGEPLRIEASGLIAKCLQHEIDHLNGRLIIDIGEEVLPVKAD